MASSPSTPERARASPDARSPARRFAVDDFLRVEDVARGEREWTRVTPCVRRAIEGVAYVLRRHERESDRTRAVGEALTRRVSELEVERGSRDGTPTTMVMIPDASRRDVEALRMELAEARHEASEKRCEALEDAVRELREELASARAVASAMVDRVGALEALHATTASKTAMDLFELETTIETRTSASAEASARAVDSRLDILAGEIADVRTMSREMEVEVQETRAKANQTALALASADIPALASELEIVKARAVRASQDANLVNDALLEVRENSESIERLTEECREDVRRVGDTAERVRETYEQFEKLLAKTEEMQTMANEFVETIDARGHQALDHIEKEAQRIATLGEEIASTSEQHAHLVQEQGEALSSQLKEWGVKVVQTVSEKAESSVNEVMEYRLREIESSVDSVAARNAEKAAQEARKAVTLAEEALRKTNDEDNAFKDSVLSSVNKMKAASDRADELKQWINKQFTTFAELREESIAALRGSEKSSVDMLANIAEEHIRSMKRVLGEAEATRGIVEAGFKTRIDRLDERFERFEARVASSELRVESCEVSMKLEKAAAGPNAEAQAKSIAAVEKTMKQNIAAVEKNMMENVNAVEKDLRLELTEVTDRAVHGMRRELTPIQEALFGGDIARSPIGSPFSKSSMHIDVYSATTTSYGDTGPIQARLMHLARKQDEQDLIIHSMHESMERTIKDRPSTTSVRELIDGVSKRVDALQEVVEWDKHEKQKTKRILTELRGYVDSRCAKLETTALRDWNKIGAEKAEMIVSKESYVDHGRKFVTHPELQAAIAIVEEHIKRLSRRMESNSSESNRAALAGVVDADLISF